MLSAKLHAFHLQACFLLLRGFVAQFDLTASAQHSMPRKMVRRIDAQKPCDCAMVERIASRCCNSPIGADFSCRNGKDDATKCSITQFIRPRPITQDPTFRLRCGDSQDVHRAIKAPWLVYLFACTHLHLLDNCFVRTELTAPLHRARVNTINTVLRTLHYLRTL